MPDRMGEGSAREETLLTLDDVTMRVRDRKLLAHTDWKIRRGEQWAVLGPNGSGKSTLARTIAGELPSASGHIRLGAGERISLVSFESQAELYARELELDHARHFAGRPDEVLTPRRLFAADGSAPPDLLKTSGGVAHGLEISHLLDRPFRHLSAGEMRKAIIVRALLTHPTLLILDEPFDGLDSRSRRSLSEYLEELVAAGLHVLLVTHRAEEILPSVSHVLMLRDGQLVAMGPRQALLETGRLEALYGASFGRADVRRERRDPATADNDGSRADVGALPDGEHAIASATGGGTRSGNGQSRQARPQDRGRLYGEAIVEMAGVNVRYGEITVIRNLSWALRRGERWGLFGPNGSGKTTILNLIVGDNLQGYANDIRLFGRRRGSGESIWDIRSRIGIVTPQLQLGYRHSSTGLEVVISGVFGSIGLYRRPSEDESAAAERWMERLGISDLANRHFNRLSYGQRRLLLIARAMVKEPELLVLDEPCQGLDPGNRHRVLEAIDAACDSRRISLLYVSHHDDERPHCLTNILHLSGSGGPAAVELLD